VTFCTHCGSDAHDAEHCTVKEATSRILEGYTPRGATAGVICPNCGVDGIWTWLRDENRQQYLGCMNCGARRGTDEEEVEARQRQLAAYEEITENLVAIDFLERRAD